MQNRDNWKPKDFLAFLLLHMAYADNELSKSEMYHIANKLGADRAISMREYVQKIDPEKRLKIIGSKRKELYPTEYGKQTLLTHIHELCLADGEFSDSEKDILQKIEKIL